MSTRQDLEDWLLRLPPCEQQALNEGLKARSLVDLSWPTLLALLSYLRLTASCPALSSSDSRRE